MSSYSSNTNYERFNPDDYVYDCGKRAPRWTSRTYLNPGRRFHGCPNYEDPTKKCDYRWWVDEELTPYYKQYIALIQRKLEISEQKCIQDSVKARELQNVADELKAKYVKSKSKSKHMEGLYEKMKERSTRMEVKAKRLEVLLCCLLFVVAVLVWLEIAKMRTPRMLYLP